MENSSDKKIEVDELESPEEALSRWYVHKVREDASSRAALDYAMSFNS